MPFSGLDIKRIYYYVICAMAFFVFMWGAIDLIGSSIGIVNFNSSNLVEMQGSQQTNGLATEKGDQLVDSYYQKKMLFDRFWDSLVRVLVSGLIFGYCRIKVKKLEENNA